MFKLRPITIALGAGLLQACATPPAPQAITMQPVLQVRNSADQTAATYYQLGKYHQARGNLDLARAAYAESIALDSRQLEPRNALAGIHFQQGRFNEAKTLLLQLVAEFPSVVHPHNNLGYIQYMQGEYAAAADTLQRALSLDANNERVRNNLVTLRLAVASRGPATPMASLPVPGNSQFAGAKGSNSEPARVADGVRLTAGGESGAVADIQSSVISQVKPPRAETVEPAALLVPRFPMLVTQSRMELVAVAPNVFDLKLKSTPALAVEAPAPRLELVAVATDVYELKLKSTTVLASPPLNGAPDKVTLAAADPARAVVGKAARLEVANGNGVNGMAKRIGSTLGQKGIAVSRLTNERPYTQQATKIQYRAGYEQAAESLKRAMNGHAVLVQASDLSAHTDVRLVLGRDAVSHMAQIENHNNQANVATNSHMDTGGSY